MNPIEPTELAANYQNMSDDELLDLARDYDSLSEIAQPILRDEFRSRKLGLPVVAPPEKSPSDELARNYSKMSNAELLDVARGYDWLSDIAQPLLRDEFRRRKLDPPMLEVAPLGEPRPNDPLDQPISIASYRDMSEAIVARQALESAGIYSFLHNEMMIRENWLYSDMTGGIQLQVASRDEQAALEILDQAILPQFYTDAGEFKQPACPRCKSLDVIFQQGLDKKAVAASALIGVPMPFTINEWKCNSCGHVWDEDLETTSA